MSKRSLEDVIQAAGNPVTLLRNQQTGPNVYPGVPPEYTNWRDETQAWQKTCVLFNQSYHMADLAGRRTGRREAAHTPGRQQLRQLRRRQGQAVRALQLRRLRDRRRDPVLPRRKPVQSRRPHPGAQLDHVPRGHRRLRREGHARRALGGAARPVQPQGVSLPAPGPERDEGAGEGDRRQGAGAQVLQHGPRHHRRQTRARAAPRHGRPARLRAVRTVRRARC